ncbi:MAG: MFS transporter [Planctomycetota bacterium]
MDFEQDIKRNYWWNLGIIAGVDGCWGFGMAFVHQVAIIPAFLDRLGASAVTIGLLPAVSAIALFTPQLLAAHFTRHLSVKKNVFTVTHYPGTLSLLALACLTVRYASTAPAAVMVSTFAWAVLFGLSISFAMPMWLNLMAKLFPAAVRGRAFGYVWLLNGVLGAAGALCAERVLGAVTFPWNFAVLFAASGVILSGCVTSFFWLREPARVSPDARGTGAFLRDVKGILRSSPDFLWFLAARFTGTFSMMAVAFYTVAGLERYELPSAAAGMFGATLLTAQVVGSLVGGRLGDTFGFKVLLVLAPATDIGAGLLAIFAPNPVWYSVVFVLFGLQSSFLMIGGHNLTIEYCPTEDKTTFVALASTILCPAYVFAPLLGGLLARYHPARYNAVFAVAACCGLLALLVTLLKVVEPRRRSAIVAPPAGGRRPC